MVKLLIINSEGERLKLQFKSTEDACKAMDALSSTVAADIAFTVSFEKESPSRFL